MIHINARIDLRCALYFQNSKQNITFDLMKVYAIELCECRTHCYDTEPSTELIY